ncbi:MAG: hypothetical protein JWQ75_1347, partial [Pseudarthrobacter sp.]|nr:hypothetical protein [Pseudarthrobacter sp.]
SWPGPAAGPPGCRILASPATATTGSGTPPPGHPPQPANTNHPVGSHPPAATTKANTPTSNHRCGPPSRPQPAPSHAVILIFRWTLACTKVRSKARPFLRILALPRSHKFLAARRSHRLPASPPTHRLPVPPPTHRLLAPRPTRRWTFEVFTRKLKGAQARRHSEVM